MLENVDISPYHVMLGGTVRDSPLSAQVTYILILLVKLYIWNSKQFNVIPSLNGFKACAENYIAVERCIAGMTGTVHKFNQKWAKLIELLKNSERPP